ncbi:Alpha galactosidase A [Granulicella pectinivorans]|uniref:Alpha-galactosidase n=1 Tax=Granulicella pectinivorans TaxID=474950 RepID=A0A1I6LR00_9BACT|nr:alpha-galactosidase [Granulicella pectinivorans]SFS05809.1 Alpha galactosidase A [Granulicella pectinivorans]
MRIRLFAFVLMIASGVVAQTTKPVAATPPMGWNSWDAYGLTITEEQFRANVKVLATALKPYGWNYAVIDEGWFMVNPTDSPKPSTSGMLIDAYGRYIPAVTRFPSAVGDRGFEQIGRDVHAAGLKFGIHIVRGIPRMAVIANTPVEGSAFHAVDVADQEDACPWDPTNWGVKDNAAGQAYYDSLLRQFAGWGVDLLKVDCISDHPYKVDEIRMIRRAIEKAGRPVVLSLSPGPTNLSHAAEVGELAQMWRISDDIWDVWKAETGFPQSVTSQFARVAAWEKYAKPGNWPDADMLPLGELRPQPGWGKARTSRLTEDESKTQITLWAMARSPLILGANLTMLDGFTTTLLVNRDLIRIDQASMGSREVSHEGDLIAWTADLPGREKALALFNVGDTPMTMDVEFAKYGLGKGKYRVRNVWDGTAAGRTGEVKGVVVPAHGCVVWMLRAGAGEDLLGD